MGINSPKTGALSTTDQSPRWEGPQENTPGSNLRAKDDPDQDRDANDESNSDPEVNKMTHAFKTKGD